MTLRALACGGLGFVAASAGLSLPAIAQQLAMAPQHAVLLPASTPALSADCGARQRVPGDRFRRPLRALSRAVHASRPVKVLAIGSSSTAGVGASSPASAYAAQLETRLETMVKGLDVEMTVSGQGGEEAEGTAERMKREVEKSRPDLVVWQVGTNDARENVGVERFKRCLNTQLDWLKKREIDVVLIDPQYGNELAKNEHYGRVVAAVAEVARDQSVLLVDRFDAMREMALLRGDRFYLSSDNLHLNDTGHRCMAEQLARSIVAGLLSAELEGGTHANDAARTAKSSLAQMRPE